MPNIVGITKDPKLLSDLDKFTKELGGDELRFAGFHSLAEFESLYFKTPSQPPEPLEGNEEEGADLRLFSEVHFIIFAEDALKESDSPKECGVHLLEESKTHGLWPEENRTRIIYLKFEEDGFDKLSVMHPAIEDLIFLPLDKPLFMQKLELFLGLPELIKPSYLFTQEVDESVEVSKIVTLERLNDCSLAIRNIVPLKPGVRGKFYLTPPASKKIIRFFGKAYRTEPHPEYPGEYLVYFFFFGVRKNEISIIRQWLSSSNKYHSLKKDDPKQFAFNPDNMFLSEDDRRVRSVAIIDQNQDHAEHLKEFLERKIDLISISHFSSYRLFHELGLSSGQKEDFEPKAGESSHLPKGQLSILCDPGSKNLLKISPEPDPELLFCGRPMNEVFVEGQNSWWKIFDLKQNEVHFEDAASGFFGNTRKLLFAKDSEENWLGFNVTFEKNEKGLSLNFEIVETSELIDQMQTVKQIEQLDAIIIDTAFVSDNFESWLTGLIDQAKAAGALKDPEKLKIIFMSEKEDHLDEAWLKCDNVMAYILKPADHKSVAVTLVESLKLETSVYTFSNLGWIHPHLRTHLSKPVQLSQLSEYGATINTSTPFKEGSFFFLRKGIFDEAPNDCLSARVYKTIAHPSEEGRYLAHVTYFGINDSFLKHARSFMREKYAESKGSSDN